MKNESITWVLLKYIYFALSYKGFDTFTLSIIIFVTLLLIGFQTFKITILPFQDGSLKKNYRNKIIIFLFKKVNFFV